MILLWGISDDRPLGVMREVLAERGAPVFFLDQTRAAETDFDLSVSTKAEGWIRVGEDVCDLETVSAIYVRCRDARSLTPALDHTDAALRHAVELDDLVATWLSLTGARVVNSFAAMASNGSKPYQLSLIAKAGFAVPDTLLSTDADAVKEFWERHGEIIYKSTSGIRSIVSRLKIEDMYRLQEIRWCPTQFQQHIAGRDYRVHVVEDEVFATEILSEADDYRYGERQGFEVELRPYSLPDDCAARCRALAASLDLPVAGIDLRRTPDGEWYCFEVNPSPAFSYYEAATHQPISEAIAALLADDRVGRPA
jgi:glutathione synthase/RimK-type ligase-like ATP-grasp enzyme